MIKWTNQEWHLVAQSMLEANPALRDATHLPLDTVAQLAQAQARLPAARRRPLPANSGGWHPFAKRLVEEFQRLRAGAAPASDDLPERRIFWDVSEWDALLAALVARHPHLLGVQRVDDFGDLIPTDVSTAQQLALAPERQRTGKLHMATLRPGLFKALERYRAGSAKPATPPTPALTATPPPLLEPEPAAGPAPAPISAPPPPPEPTPEPPPAAITAPPPPPAEAAAAQAARTEAGRVTAKAPPAPGDLNGPAWTPRETDYPATNPYEAAFAPLVRPFMALFAHELGNAMLPRLAGLVRAEVGAALREAAREALAAAPAMPATPATPSAPPEPARPLPFLPPAAPRTPRPSIGILGNRLTYKDELQREFPQLDIICIDSFKKIPSIANCTRALSMISYLSHEADKKLKRAAGDRYIPVNGTLTDIKRVITGLINSGALLPGNLGGVRRAA